MARVQMVSNPEYTMLMSLINGCRYHAAAWRCGPRFALSARFCTTRKTIERIIDGQDACLIVVVAVPYDPTAALDYARRLKALASEAADSLYLGCVYENCVPPLLMA